MKLLVIQCAALGHDLVARHPELWDKLPLTLRPLQPTFPAVTGTAQATFRTGLPPHDHGIIGNGLYDRELRKPLFWEQSAALLPQRRIWDGFRARGGRVGLVCWQQSLGDTADLIVSPAPIHKHGGGMIQALYTQPPELAGELRAAVGRDFNLHSYWGPLAGLHSTRWIAEATAALLRRQACDLLLTYLPHLDYALQRHGPQDEKNTRRAVAQLVCELRKLLAAAAAAGYETLIFGDYAITPAHQVLFPNRELRKAGLFQVRAVKGMAYPDLHASRAFALVDHQVAHLYVKEARDLPAVKELFLDRTVVAKVAETPPDGSPWSRRAGDLVLTAARGTWFAYPWWEARREEPEFASHVDIHNKPGFDPCELHWGWPPPAISRNPARVGGTHGRGDAPAAWGATVPLDPADATRQASAEASLLDLSHAVERLLAPEPPPSCPSP
ncbi:MAG: nucleotide pyrophosphatase/phosphodiesterase family protein [Lentisphaeria bacterium]|jgi:predicted AlkP superfamily pyrophosphatase or phosphodiesterase